MPPLKTYRLFISHAWKYGDDYDRMVDLLNDASYFSWANYSVPVDKAFEKMTKSQLKDELRDQIRPVNAVLILGGMYVSYSDWIQFEIDFAQEIGKPIIGVKPWGAKVMPKAVSDAADVIVGWNTSTVVQAIRDYAL